MKRLSVLFVLCLVLPTSAQQPSPIRLPVLPAPVPTPTTVTRLSADQLYIIDSDIACIVLTSPSGLISVSSETGPLKIRGKFVDGNGKTETRTYKGKYVYSLEAIGTGKAELLVIPANSADESGVIRRTLDVTVAPGPVPPVPPDPPPIPPGDPFVKALQDAYNTEADPNRAVYLAKYVSLLKMAGAMAADDKTWAAAGIKTYADLFQVLQLAKTQLGLTGTLPKVWAVVGADMNAVFGTSTTALVDRAKLIAEAKRIADSLGAVK
jgi:hypothetical protein